MEKLLTELTLTPLTALILSLLVLGEQLPSLSLSLSLLSLTASLVERVCPWSVTLAERPNREMALKRVRAQHLCL